LPIKWNHLETGPPRSSYSEQNTLFAKHLRSIFEFLSIGRILATHPFTALMLQKTTRSRAVCAMFSSLNIGLLHILPRQEIDNSVFVAYG
jgi:hypothetical protein